MGTGIVWWLRVGSPAVDGGGAAVWTATSAAMLAAFVTGVGSRWSWRTGRIRVADPIADTWWVLNAYPIFPAMGVLFGLRDAGVLTWEQQPLAALVVWAVLLFARGTVLLSPVGPRALQAIETRTTRDQPAGWLVFGAGGAYVLAAIATFGAAATGQFWLGAVTSIGGLTTIHVAAAALARRPDSRAAAPQ